MFSAACFIASYTSLTSSNALLKLLAFFIAWLESVFIWRKEITIPTFDFKKKKKKTLNEQKNVKKSLYYILPPIPRG